MPPKGRAQKGANPKPDSGTLDDLEVGVSATAQAGKRKRDLPTLGTAKLTLSKRPSNDLQPQIGGGAKQEVNSIEDLQQWAQNHFTRLNAVLEVDMSASCLAGIKDMTTAIQTTAKDHQTRSHALLASSKEVLENAQTQHAQALAAVANAQTELTNKVEKDRSQLLAELHGGAVAESMKTIKALQSKYKL